MEISLAGRRSLVCGATQGIGYGIAQSFAQAGSEVILSGRSESRLQKAVETLPGEGHQWILLDQADNEALPEAIGTIQKLDVDILVNNTGGPEPGLASEETWENFEKALRQHLRFSQELVLAVLPHMKEKGFGRIINIISTSVKIPIYGLGVSNTVRGAMASWAKTLSLEIASAGITVNNILPGFIKTGRLEQIIQNTSEKQGVSTKAVEEQMKRTVPSGEFGTPEDLACLATFLASEKARYINGTNIPVDGGKTGSL